ncbi:MAG: exodeoxyribonuclease VII small subunit [Planctomycetota bacterium]|nr:exodeoxyribonuclease VII small subunit [Planctomycetota bacterium]
MAKPAKKKPFKQRLDQLTELVEDLERGELDLEDAILKFEEGQKLHRGLMDELGAYEKRLEKLVRGPDGEDALTDVGEE